MVEEAIASSGTESCSDNERSSAENVTIIAEAFSDVAPSTTLSSVQSEDSAKQLICKSPQSPKGRQRFSVDTKSATLECGMDPNVEKLRMSPETCSKSMLTSLQSDTSIRDHSEGKQPKLILYLGIGQLLVGVAMVITGGLVIVHGSALGRTGAGLWSGCMAITTGILGVLAGINDCYGLYDKRTSRMGNMFLTLFLALSLIALAAGNLAAVLAGTGLLRDVRRPEPSTGASPAEQDEYLQKYWAPIFANVGLLLSASLHCLLALISVYHTAKRICACFRPREPFNHNQFDPTFTNYQTPYSVVSISEKVDKASKYSLEIPASNNARELSRVLEGKLVGPVTDVDAIDGPEPNLQEEPYREFRKVSSEILHDPQGVGSYFGSANSKDKLVCNWLGGQPGLPMKVQKLPKGMKKNKMKQPVLLYPAGAGNTMTRPMPMVPVSASRLGYATLPMMPVGPPTRNMARPMPPPHVLYPPLYAPYSVNDMIRVKRKHYASSSPSNQGQKRGNHLTRSLERIHRQRKSDEKPSQKVKKMKKKSKGISEADVIKTYTGLDRTIAEQFINACNENRHGHPESHGRREKSDSSGFDTASSGSHSNKY